MKDLNQWLNIFFIIAAPLIGISVFIYIIVRSFLNFINFKEGRPYIIFKALVSLIVWLLMLWGWFFVFYVTAYTAAANGNFADEERIDLLTLLFSDLIYAFIGCLLILWMGHNAEKAKSVSHLAK